MASLETHEDDDELGRQIRSEEVSSHSNRPRINSASSGIYEIITHHDDNQNNNNTNNSEHHTRRGLYGKSITLLAGLYRRTSHLVKRQRSTTTEPHNEDEETSNSSRTHNNNNNINTNTS
eukprot:13060517-Ditylum_brightwellii.AAC.1